MKRRLFLVCGMLLNVYGAFFSHTPVSYVLFTVLGCCAIFISGAMYGRRYSEERLGRRKTARGGKPTPPLSKIQRESHVPKMP